MTYDPPHNVDVYRSSSARFIVFCYCTHNNKGSSEIRSVLTSRENGTLHLTWQPPDSPGGTILNYTVQIIPLNDEETRSEVTTTTMFSATNLSEYRVDGFMYN